MVGRNRGICHSCRKTGHFLSDCPTKKQCPKCGEGIEKCMEVEIRTKNKGRLFFCCTKDCGHFKWVDEEEPDDVPCTGTCKDKRPCQNLSCMFTRFAEITETKDVEISVNVTMRKGKRAIDNIATEPEKSE